MPKSATFTFSAWIAALLLLVQINASAADVHPASTLVESGLAAMRTDPEASRRAAESALALLAKNPQADLEIRARLLLCDYQSERDAAAAEQEADAASRLLAGAQRQGLLAGILTCRGEIREALGNNDAAAPLYEEAVAAATRALDDEMLAGALYSRGNLLGLQGRYAAGLSDLENALALYERIDMPLHALTILNAIATLYNRMGDYEQAQHIYVRALKAQTDAGMRREQIVTLHNLGRTHENLLQWESARDAFQRCLAISRELDYPRGEAYALRGLAAVAVAVDQADEALQFLQQAATLQSQIPDARLGAQIDLARGMALHKLGRDSDAAVALGESLRVFEQTDALAELRIIYAELASVHNSLGDGRLAYEYRTRAQAVSEQLFKNQLDERFATLKVKFDTAAKEKENAMLLRENEANAKALEQGRKVRQLQAAVIVLTAVLATLLATLVLRQRRNTARMRALAMTDELTGVPNRRAVLMRLERLLERTSSSTSVLVVDIDYFKSINDEYGHAEGDQALKLVAATLRGAIVEPSFIGRLGGEEFIIVLPNTDVHQACATAETVRKHVMKMDTSRWLDRGITVSIGVAASGAETNTPSSMLQRADAALYTAKRSGRNCVRTAVAAVEHPQAFTNNAAEPLPTSD